MQSSNFENKTILITGGSSGIGLASAQAFLDQGAKRIYVTGRDTQKLKQVQEQLGERVVGIDVDVAHTEQITRLKMHIESNQDQLDVVFVNAGIAENNLLGETSEAQFDASFNTNVKGLFFTVQTLLPLIKQGGNIILNASVASKKGMPNLSVYSASKAAVRSFARTWCNDLKDRKIRVNTISPGVTKTPILQTGLKMTLEHIAEFTNYLAVAVPEGRMADASEIASAVTFLASNAASYINGVELAVDGGFTQI
jgi:NAD(P)-dependent dehydrogenase (short-subunit alcohol dehydrogenase family)